MMKEYFCIVDTETTGLSKQLDWIIQLSAIKVAKKDLSIMDKFNAYIRPPGDFEIGQAAMETHGLTKEFILQAGRPLKEVGPEFLEFIRGCDLAGFNSNNFDMEFLYKDFSNAGLEFPFDDIIHYDIRWMEVRLKPNRLGDLFERYTGKTMEEAGLTAHDSLSDVMATLEVMKHQFETYNLTWEEIDTWEENNLLVPDGCVRKASKPDEPELVVFSKGKYTNKDVYEVMKSDPSYMRWAAGNLFSKYTLKVVRDYCLLRQKKEKEAKPSINS